MPGLPELERRTVGVDGDRRPWFVAVPAGAPSAVVLCLHGRGTDPAWQARLSGMDRLAADRGAVVVFPQGSWQVDRRGYSWDPQADLPYLDAVVEAVRREFPGTAPRVGVCGMSAGARMASHFAAARAEDVAALGAVAGVRAPRSRPTRPVPVIAFHGLADRALPFAGGPGGRGTELVIRWQNRRAGRIPERDGWWQESVPEAVRAWAVANGVEGDRSERRLGPALSRTTYGEGTGGEVTLWTFAGAGHTWPGHPAGFPLGLVVGRTSREVDATEAIWRFLRRHEGEGSDRPGA